MLYFIVEQLISDDHDDDDSTHAELTIKDDIKTVNQSQGNVTNNINHKEYDAKKTTKPDEFIEYVETQDTEDKPKKKPNTAANDKKTTKNSNEDKMTTIATKTSTYNDVMNKFGGSDTYINSAQEDNTKRTTSLITSNNEEIEGMS